MKSINKIKPHYIKNNEINIETYALFGMNSPENYSKHSLLNIAFQNQSVSIIDFLIKYLKDPIDNIGMEYDEQFIVFMMERYEDTKDPMFLIKMNMSYEDILDWAISENMDNTIKYAVYKMIKEGKQLPDNLPKKYKNSIKNIMNNMNKEVNKLNRLPNNVTRYIIKPMVKYTKKARKQSRKTRKSRK